MRRSFTFPPRIGHRYGTVGDEIRVWGLLPPAQSSAASRQKNTELELDYQEGGDSYCNPELDCLNMIVMQDLGGARDSRSAVREMEVIGNNLSVLLETAKICAS